MKNPPKVSETTERSNDDQDCDSYGDFLDLQDNFPETSSEGFEIDWGDLD